MNQVEDGWCIVLKACQERHVKLVGAAAPARSVIISVIKSKLDVVRHLIPVLLGFEGGGWAEPTDPGPIRISPAFHMRDDIIDARARTRRR